MGLKSGVWLLNLCSIGGNVGTYTRALAQESTHLK